MQWSNVVRYVILPKRLREMGKEVNLYCDCCGDLVQSDGIPCKGESTTFYKMKGFHWETSSRWFGWRLFEKIEPVIICGLCFEAIGDQVRKHREAKRSKL